MYKKVEQRARGFMREGGPYHRNCMLEHCSDLATVKAQQCRNLIISVWYCEDHAHERGIV